MDMDGDGDLDLAMGNMGLNSRLRTSAEHPVHLYAGDFDKNDSTDQLLTYFIGEKEYPFHTRDELTKQMPYLKKKYLSYQKFAATSFHEMFSDELLAIETCVVENLGGLKFRMKRLPVAAQFSTVNGILADDLNADGKVDLLLAGNFYPINIQMGRNDASYGLYLQGDGNGNFKSVAAIQSGFRVQGEVRKLLKLSIAGRTHFMAVRNNDSVQCFVNR
jgi:hypothetical protein